MHSSSRFMFLFMLTGNDAAVFHPGSGWDCVAAMIGPSNGGNRRVVDDGEVQVSMLVPVILTVISDTNDDAEDDADVCGNRY